MRKENGMKYNRVLLADGHPNMIEGIRGLLETLFQCVVMVADGDSLFDAVETIKPDLVVVDFSLSCNDEPHIGRQLRRRFPALKFIVLSVHDDPSVVYEAMAGGAKGYVLKRTAGTDLIPAAETVLKGHRYVSPCLDQRTRSSKQYLGGERLN